MDVRRRGMVGKLTEEVQSEELSVNGRTILYWMLSKQVGSVWTDWECVDSLGVRGQTGSVWTAGSVCTDLECVCGQPGSVWTD
jgi:hypothetical protein